MVLQAQLQNGVKTLHVLGEGLPTCICEGTHCQHGFLMHTSCVTLENTQQSLHDRICLFQQTCLGQVAVTQLLDDNLQHSTQQSLQSMTFNSADKTYAQTRW